MNKTPWAEYNAIIEWLQKHQQKGEDVFKNADLRTAFNLNVTDCQVRLRQLIKWGLIESVKLGHYGILDVNPQKIQEIKNSYIPKGSVFEEYEFKGEVLSLRAIFNKYKPPIDLDQFSQRIARGWTIQEAMQPPLRRQRESD